MKLQPPKEIKVCLGIATNRGVKPRTLQSLLELTLEFPYEIVPVVATEGLSIADNRLYIVLQAMNAKCTHILFVDDDMIFDSNVLSRLLSAHKQIVGVASNSRMLPLKTTVKFLDESGNYMPPFMTPTDFKMPEKLFKCYAVGMGVCLIDMKVFDEIKIPWFKFDVNESGGVKTGEDVWFCEQARKAGIDVWCDPTIKIGHIGEYIY